MVLDGGFKEWLGTAIINRVFVGFLWTFSSKYQVNVRFLFTRKKYLFKNIISLPIMSFSLVVFIIS